MAIVDEILSARNCGVVRCGVSKLERPSLERLAGEFGLQVEASRYQEIGGDAACRLVFLALHQDLAYCQELVPVERAVHLAEHFVDAFDHEDTRFYTNGNFHEGPGDQVTWPGASWNPMTESTFDTGVLVIGPALSGVFWVEDED